MSRSPRNPSWAFAHAALAVALFGAVLSPGATVANPAAPVVVASGATTSNLPQYPLGQVSLTAGHLYVAFVALSETSASLDPTPGVVGPGTTWTQIDAGQASKGGLGLTAYRFQPSTNLGAVSLSTGALSTTHEGLVFTVVDVGAGFDPTAPVAQFKVGSSSRSTGYTLSLPSVPASDSLVLASFLHAANEGSTPNAGWTEAAGSDASHGSPNRGAHVIYDDASPSRTPGSSWTTSAARRGIAIEIAAEGSSPPDGIRVAAAGDICGFLNPCLKTSDRVLAIDPDVVLALGDLVYPTGTLTQFRERYCGNYPDCIRWGRPAIQDVTLPAYGNHDCVDVPIDTGATKQGCEDAVTYFGPDRDFGTDIAGTSGSYWTVRGPWLIVVLNSAGDVGSGEATAQEIAQQDAALDAVLGADDHLCELVVWHHPRYASGDHGNIEYTDPWFETAYAHGVDLVLGGNAHSYERFAPQDGDGNAVADGVRQFVVGTGGAELDPSFGPIKPNSEASIVDYGVLDLTLGDDAYTWRWLDADDGSVFDPGSAACHA